MALNFRLFNCDRTFNLDKVEALIQGVAKKLSRETKIEKTYFPLPRMDELCKELEKEGSHFEYAVFVVHAHESRLSINEKNAGIGYAKVYRALQKATDDRVLVVIGGDDNYKDQESDMSFLSRWAWYKIFSQFSEDYVNGMKSFIFSWEENHHPIHEEALEFYLDPTKRGTKFVPRPKPPRPKVPEKVETKKTEQAKLSEQKNKELQSIESRKFLEKEHDPLSELKEHDTKSKKKHTFETEFPSQHNKDRKLPMLSDPGRQEINRAAQPSQPPTTQLYPNLPAQTNKPTDPLVVPFYSEKESVSSVYNLFVNVCKELEYNSSPMISYWSPKSVPQEVLKNKPRHLVLVSDYREFKDLFSRHDNHDHVYHDILKNSKSVGTKLLFIITEDENYREVSMSSDVVDNIFTKLNQNIPSSEQPTIMSLNKTSWSTHQDALKQFLSRYGGVRAAPQRYGATKQGPISRVPNTQPEHVPMKRRLYRASISYGCVVEVLKSDPPGWKPETRCLDDLLSKFKSEKKATIECFDEWDGRLQCKKCQAKLAKIAEEPDTEKMHSILVYSYHVEEETNEILRNFIRHLDVHVLSPCQPIEPASLMEDIMCVNPGYVMFSADADVLEDEGEVKKLIREQGGKIGDIIKNDVGQGVIIMLFGDKYYKDGELLASNEATKYVSKLIQGIVQPNRLTVMTCKNKPYTTHQDKMKDLLRLQNMSSKEFRHPHKGLLRYKANIKFGQVDVVVHKFPGDWQPDEFILKDVLEKNKREEQATLEFWEENNGQINPIVTISPKGFFAALPSPSIPRSFPSLPSLPAFCSRGSGKKKSGKSDV